MTSKPPDNVTSPQGPLDWPPEKAWHHEARQWRALRRLRFVGRQQRLPPGKRNWICFRDLAERYARETGVSPSYGYEQLRLAFLRGEFESNGRSRVLFWHPTLTTVRMTRSYLQRISDLKDAPGGLPQRVTLEGQYLANCWIPRDIAAVWLKAQNLNGKGLVTPITRPGMPTMDDSEAVAEGLRLVSLGFSNRAAAEHLVGTFNLRGASGEAKIDRIRRKIAASLNNAN